MLTPEAKKLLAETIRGTAQDPAKGLRAKLLRAVRDEAERRYRLSISMSQAGLDEGQAKRRARIEAYVDERVRASKAKTNEGQKATKERVLRQAEKDAAATFLNRVVLLRQLEAAGLSRPPVLTGGWSSKGYKEFREFAPALANDESEGFATLLQFVFDELAIDLPGLFGDVGLARLFPIPASMLREVVERLDDADLASAWVDDTTFGWVYQYWNDPDREALDKKINDGGKIEPHEIASKTQMFTERYMVEWLLQNSLGLTWLCMCKKRGWTADAERVLPGLETRRAEWRAKRDAGDVALDALMPIHGTLEDDWKYFVPQPLLDDLVEKAPASVRDLKVLDPACGSGHFLVIAFGLLASLYREEARHQGRSITDAEIAESILANNLHGIDIDPRAIQIAAAALYVKAKSFAKDTRIGVVNLVAPTLQLGNLPLTDPAVVALRRDLRYEVGIPEELTDKLLSSLAGVDYLGSLLKVHVAVEQAIQGVELEFEKERGQGDLFLENRFPLQQVKLSADQAKATILARLEGFLANHSHAEDLGLRLDGEQIAAGVRFVRMIKEGTYDVVVGNPPYQGLSKTASFEYVAKHYPNGKADLYAAFLERGLQLVKLGGLSALLTMRGWMFLGQYADLRKRLLHDADLRCLGDFDRGAFDEVPNEVLAVAAPIFRRASPSGAASVASQPTPLSDVSYDRQRTNRKRAAVLAQVGRHEFDARGFDVIDGEPIVYWWSGAFLKDYGDAPKLGTVAPVRTGLCTSNNTRFLRKWWELRLGRVSADATTSEWVWFVSGARGLAWVEPCDDACVWRAFGLEVKVFNEHLYRSYTRTVQNEAYYFRTGVAYTPIGSTFRARIYRRNAVMGKMGSSVFGDDLAMVLCSMNTTKAGDVLQSLNPGVHFEVGDVNRLPLVDVDSASDIVETTLRGFGEREAHRENSYEFRRPGSCPWKSVQEWAQRAVDRGRGERLPPYEPVHELPSTESFVSFGVGVALGRFGSKDEGILRDAPTSALPNGILFLSRATDDDCLTHPSCSLLLATWNEHGAKAAEGYDNLGEYLRLGFFASVHKPMYENRPIYFPLSSSKKNFVAYVSIHRWQDATLSVVLADHLMPTRRKLEGELEDLRTARVASRNKGKAEKRFTEVQKFLEELNDFIAKVTEIAERGPPPCDEKTTKREVDAPYAMDLDDGVMVNSAALWPLLEPQWKDPKKWWKELANAQGKKDYDWSHLAARYFPSRVRSKCVTDPSLAVAHGCFWELHPAKAYAWELRLQDEIRPDFTIDEVGSDEGRARFLADHADEAKALVENERKRRERKAKKDDGASDAEPLLDAADDDGDVEDEVAHA